MVIRMHIYADFNNRDSSGHLRLNCDGTIRDLAERSILLAHGLALTVSDGDLLADIIVHAPGNEGVWTGNVVGKLRDLSVGGGAVAVD